MKRICILGSTGSIGSQALEIISNHKEKYKAVALSCNSNYKLLEKQIALFEPEVVSVGNSNQAESLRKAFPKLDILYGTEGLREIVKLRYDLVLNGIVGIAGLLPTYESLLRSNPLALANKESLVVAGEIMMKLSQEKMSPIIPVDSEHNAIFQCLQAGKNKDIKRLILTASGGPFFGKSLKELGEVTVTQALNHPIWSMGKKITIDSASMMNKGLEIIEARWLFDVGYKDIEVLIHRQSVVHSLVEFIDGSILCQMGRPDMKGPIGYALAYPERLRRKDPPFDLPKEGGNLTFSSPDYKTFKSLRLAREAGEKGGSYPVVLNAANEILVQRFLGGEIPFTDIQDGIEEALNSHKASYNLSVEEILELDEGVRREMKSKKRDEE